MREQVCLTGSIKVSCAVLRKTRDSEVSPGEAAKVGAKERKEWFDEVFMGIYTVVEGYIG